MIQGLFSQYTEQPDAIFVWLSDSPGHAAEFKKAYGLPEEFEVAMHLAVGYAAAGSIKSGRVPLKYMYYSRDEK